MPNTRSVFSLTRKKLSFRGSTFMPLGPIEPDSIIWFEAHETADGRMILAQLNGAPKSVRRPGFWKQFGSKTEGAQSKSFPFSNATVLKVVPTVQAAFEAILTLESEQLAKQSRLVDIGDSDRDQFGGLPHYVSLDRFATVALHDDIRRAANYFVADLTGQALFFSFAGLTSSGASMLEGPLSVLKLYNARPMLAA